jgi:hypothetical protein
MTRQQELPGARAQAGAMRIPLGLLVCAVGCAAAATGNEFETVPGRPASDLLPAAMVSGVNFHVVDPVQGDGLMNHFVVDSRFGTFTAYGREALASRIREVAALTELAKKSNADLLAGGVTSGVESEVKTVAGVVTHPVGTVTGIPKGVAHLFHGYTARAQEAGAQLQNAGGSAGAAGGRTVSDDVSKGEKAARSYADRYLGVTSAERGWYKKLGVDPYTDNQVLRDAIRKDAKIEAAGSFGVKFAGIPAIPGIGIAQRAMDSIYNEDPAAIRQRTRKTLEGYGLSAGETESWLNTKYLSPTRQLLLLTVAAELKGVAGLAELFRHSSDLASDEEAQVYLQSAGLLVVAHKAKPLKAIVPGVRLPTAELPDGSLVVCGAFEAVYYTAGVAQAEEALRRALPPQREGVGREVWLEGTVSDRARAELKDRAWVLHEVIDTATPGGAAH